MTKNPIEFRRKRYFQLSSQIALLDNAQLHSLFDNSELSAGWGINLYHHAKLQLLLKETGFIPDAVTHDG